MKPNHIHFPGLPGLIPTLVTFNPPQKKKKKEKEKKKKKRRRRKKEAQFVLPQYPYTHQNMVKLPVASSKKKTLKIQQKSSIVGT